jgi:hypothetical protein
MSVQMQAGAEAETGRAEGAGAETEAEAKTEAEAETGRAEGAEGTASPPFPLFPGGLRLLVLEDCVLTQRPFVYCNKERNFFR